MNNSLEVIEKEIGHIDVVAEMIAFIRGSKRGINFIRVHDRAEAA